MRLLLSVGIVWFAITGFMSGQMIVSPTKVYEISLEEVKEVERGSCGLLEKYVAVHEDCLPSYLESGYSGSWQFRIADTLVLRIIYDEENLEDCGETLAGDINNRARDMFLGFCFKVQFEPDLIDDAYAITRSESYFEQVISAEFGRKSNEVIIIIDPIFTVFYADVDTKVISMTEGGINAHIILHEVGHLWGLDHPTACCFPCDSLPKHFMYDHVSPYPTYNKIMIQDWLEIIDKCGGNLFCSDCRESPIGMLQDGQGRNPLAKFASYSEPVADREPYKNFIYCIDCKVDQVDLETTSLKNLIALCKEISKQKKLLQRKFEVEFEYYNSDMNISNAQKNDYINFQVQTRRLFSFERLDVLVETKQKMIENLPEPKRLEQPSQYEKMRRSVQRSIDRERKNIQRRPLRPLNNGRLKGNNQGGDQDKNNQGKDNQGNNN